MFKAEKVIMTGGSGLLGSEIKELLPQATYPTSSEFNITDFDQMVKFIGARDYNILLHAAAFTSPPKIDENPERALEVNIIGTANIVKLCYKFSLKLIYLSTDYVFQGDKGNYKEDDPVNPVNKYAWSKFGGECAVRLYNNSLIIRTSFGPNTFPFERAFIDQWTSRESVGKIAVKIIKLLEKSCTGILHIGGKRRTVLEYARSLGNTRNLKEMSIDDVSFKVPVDTSLNTNRYNKLIK